MPQKFLAQVSSCRQEAAQMLGRIQEYRPGSPDKCMMPLSYDLKFVRNIIPQDTAPNIGLVNPIAMDTLALEKPRKSVFRQNGAENYFRFRFSLHIPILRRQLGR